MRLLNTFLVIITGVTASAALVLDMHVTIEEPKDRKQAVAHEPIPVHPAGTSKNPVGSAPYAMHQMLAMYLISVPD